MSLGILRSAWQSACGLRRVAGEVVEGESHIGFVANGEQLATIARTRLDDDNGPAVIVTALERRHPVNGAAKVGIR